ncbi:glycosyltransferase family 4 protein [Paenibacillus sp. y28]|uniref:glycosyltransferase family 4 protein n=1 Tax=Paenibacillus sp. y28 TaxID=3129110 RepID=UPI003015E503
MMYLYAIGFAAAVVLAIVLTPVVKRVAFWVGAVDAPNHRKVHTRIMPRLGGLAIFLAFIGAFFAVAPAFAELNEEVVTGLLIGGAIVVLVGALDDRYQLSPKWKLLGQIIAASVVVYCGVQIDLVNLPFGDSTVDMGWLSIPLTIFWIVGVTNAINLIDGLDGLAAGVSAIATATIMVMALIMGNITVVILSALLLGSIVGFLFYNFHPAKIFMGDSGALFLGFSLATLSILGFKQATLVSFIVPIVMLGVPLSDTFFAIVRRIVNKTPISVADKSHLHHCLLQLGFSHRKTVLVIYGIALVFGASAVLLSQATLWVTITLIAVLLLVLQLGAEAIGIVGQTRRPVLNLLDRFRSKTGERSVSK